QTDTDVHTRVPQRQRVRVALAAVTDHGDLLALDELEVGGVVVVHLCCHLGLLLVSQILRGRGVGCPAVSGQPFSSRLRPVPLCCGSQALRSTARRERSVIERGPRPRATSPDFTSSRIPKGSRFLTRASSFSGSPVASMTTTSGLTSTTCARKSSAV